MRLNHINVRAVYKQSAIYGGDHIVFAVQLADQRDHLFGQCDPLVPIIGYRGSHGCGFLR